MPSARLLKWYEDPLAPEGLSAIAAKTAYYVWLPNRSITASESSHYRRALLGGAIPCRLRGEGPTEAPGTYGPVHELCERIGNGNPGELHEAALRTYVSRGSLGEHLERALADV